VSRSDTRCRACPRMPASPRMCARNASRRVRADNNTFLFAGIFLGSPLPDSNRRPPPYHRATRREARVCAGRRGHENRTRRRNRPKTGDPPWTRVPGEVFPQCSLGVGSTKSPDERTPAQPRAIRRSRQRHLRLANPSATAFRPSGTRPPRCDRQGRGRRSRSTSGGSARAPPEGRCRSASGQRRLVRRHRRARVRATKAQWMPGPGSPSWIQNTACPRGRSRAQAPTPSAACTRAATAPPLWTRAAAPIEVQQVRGTATASPSRMEKTSTNYVGAVLQVGDTINLDGLTPLRPTSCQPYMPYLR
jgi:hypothetical protein